MVCWLFPRGVYHSVSLSVLWWVGWAQGSAGGRRAVLGGAGVSRAVQGSAGDAGQCRSVLG